MKIFANCIVKNEEGYLYYAIASVVNFVDKVIIYDTGSTDDTLKIVEYLQKKFPAKISFKNVGNISMEEFPRVRQKMLDESSNCDWVLVLDGDEVWWESSIQKITETIKKEGTELDAIIVPFINLVGDIYHYQDEKAGKYQLLGKKGFLSIKALNRKIPGLHVDRPYPQEGFFDGNNVLIQDRNSKRLKYLNALFLHFSHLQRSRKVTARNKSKFDLGRRFSNDFRYPEVLYEDAPEIQNSIWDKRQKSFIIKSALRYPLQKIWRRIR